MPQLSPRLGYYIISVGTVLQFLGLTGDSWMNGQGPQSGRSAVLTFSEPGAVLLVIGMGLTVAGTIVGMLSLASSLSADDGRSPRLLPLLPLVLLVGISLGSVSFAYQASDGSTNGSSEPAALSGTTPDTCPPGTFWHQEMGHCMPISAQDQSGTTPTCPEGYTWRADLAVCQPVDAPSVAGPTTSEGTPVCPVGFFYSCELAPSPEPSPTTSLPPDTTPAPTPEPMETPVPTMSNTCPPGLVFNPDTLYCELPGTPDPTPTPTPTETPVPTCPDGYFWHPDMNHCMSNTCPPGLVFNPDTLYCELPPGP